MATIDKNKFQFVKRDDFASEVIDAPAYSYWKSVFRQFLKKRTTIIMLAILIGILLMSFVYPMFSNFDYNDVSKVNDFSARLVQITTVNPSLMEFGLVLGIQLSFPSSPLLLTWLSELSLVEFGGSQNLSTVS